MNPEKLAKIAMTLLSLGVIILILVFWYKSGGISITSEEITAWLSSRYTELKIYQILIILFIHGAISRSDN